MPVDRDAAVHSVLHGLEACGGCLVGVFPALQGASGRTMAILIGIWLGWVAATAMFVLQLHHLEKAAHDSHGILGWIFKQTLQICLAVGLFGVGQLTLHFMSKFLVQNNQHIPSPFSQWKILYKDSLDTQDGNSKPFWIMFVICSIIWTEGIKLILWLQSRHNGGISILWLIVDAVLLLPLIQWIARKAALQDDVVSGSGDSGAGGNNDNQMLMASALNYDEL